jgi:hypothetical protein
MTEGTAVWWTEQNSEDFAESGSMATSRLPPSQLERE